jgi:nucleotide-binding universal stress UspA family protein
MGSVQRSGTTFTHADVVAAALGVPANLSRTEALARLAASEDPNREDVLSRVLQDPGERAQLRAAAAVGLGHIATERSEQFLVQALYTAPTEILPEVLGSLGRVGSPAALELIDEHKDSQADLIAAGAHFAGALITFRFGLSGHELHVPRTNELLLDPEGGERAMRIDTPSPGRTRSVLASLEHEPYGIDLATEGLTELRCGTDVHTVCVNRRFTAPGSAAALLERKWVLALAALQSRESEGHSVSFVVLASPSRRGKVDLLVPNCTGHAMLAGSAHVTGDRIAFSLRAIRRPGARGVFLDGTLGRGRLMLDRASVSVARQSAPLPARAAPA